MPFGRLSFRRLTFRWLIFRRVAFAWFTLYKDLYGTLFHFIPHIYSEEENFWLIQADFALPHTLNRFSIQENTMAATFNVPE